MDLGMVGLNGLVGSDRGIDSPLLSSPETRQRWCGSGFFKQERPEAANEDDLRSLKVAKTDDFSSSSKPMLLQQRKPNSTPLFSHGQEKMLSFSSPNSETVPLSDNYFHHSSSACSRNTGYGFGGLNSESMHGGVITGVRSPFTPTQWMELEHQALIYKYLNANVPIPSNLLISIRRALDYSTGFSGTFGWGSYHLGYSNSTDPEPGRCRRTDGKKWRCSRDAVADGKYCERHMNRGRHRSRKPVESQNGRAVSTTTPLLASVGPGGGGTTNNVGLSHHPQLKILQPSASNLCASSPHLNRIFLNKENTGERNEDPTSLSMLSGPKQDHFPIPKHPNPYEESSRAEFGRVYSDSLLNPLHQFMDDKNPLSILIPSSPANEKLALSPLRLSREIDSEMGLRVGSLVNESSQRQVVNWIPISWESSVGGPLGEVLHHSTNSSPRLSPTGVLQRMNNGFGSLSNSSAGSSPRAENRKL